MNTTSANPITTLGVKQRAWWIASAVITGLLTLALVLNLPLRQRYTAGVVIGDAPSSTSVSVDNMPTLSAQLSRSLWVRLDDGQTVRATLRQAIATPAVGQRVTVVEASSLLGGTFFRLKSAALSADRRTDQA